VLLAWFGRRALLSQAFHRLLLCHSGLPRFLLFWVNYSLGDVLIALLLFSFYYLHLGRVAFAFAHDELSVFRANALLSTHLIFEFVTRLHGTFFSRRLLMRCIGPFFHWN